MITMAVALHASNARDVCRLDDRLGVLETKLEVIDTKRQQDIMGIKQNILGISTQSADSSSPNSRCWP